MENDIIEVVPSPTEPETVPAEQGGTPAPLTAEEAEKLKETNRKLYARLKNAEDKLKTKTTQKPTEVPEEFSTVIEDVKSLKQIESKRQFGFKHGLSPEETDHLFRYAGNEDPEKVLKSPFFETALKASRRAQAVNDATPAPSNRSTVINGKSFAEMTPEERAKNWSKILKTK